MNDSVHSAGRDAARHGVPLSACPYLQAANMPGHTGEAPRAWSEKLSAWEAGWHDETTARMALLARRKRQRADQG
ncbi:hypothetical protein DXK93_05110 [Achromobacter sp. K91]|uniref:CrpP-related protein n=1 Tax=Achromobacter sp. K91 TaxID=2292262 RepID=UPI000E6726BF|nr:CrpP-related protein [Achromobacter sp. K91]RIJ05096.1 hypothetical protein DXK93_05110 [Achromobacter sp. K91]